MAPITVGIGPRTGEPNLHSEDGDGAYNYTRAVSLECWKMSEPFAASQTGDNSSIINPSRLENLKEKKKGIIDIKQQHHELSFPTKPLSVATSPEDGKEIVDSVLDLKNLTPVPILNPDVSTVPSSRGLKNSSHSPDDALPFSSRGLKNSSHSSDDALPSSSRDLKNSSLQQPGILKTETEPEPELRLFSSIDEERLLDLSPPHSTGSSPPRITLGSGILSERSSWSFKHGQHAVGDSNGAEEIPSIGADLIPELALLAFHPEIDTKASHIPGQPLSTPEISAEGNNKPVAPGPLYGRKWQGSRLPIIPSGNGGDDATTHVDDESSNQTSEQSRTTGTEKLPEPFSANGEAAQGDVKLNKPASETSGRFSKTSPALLKLQATSALLGKSAVTARDRLVRSLSGKKDGGFGGSFSGDRKAETRGAHSEPFFRNAHSQPLKFTDDYCQSPKASRLRRLFNIGDWEIFRKRQPESSKPSEKNWVEKFTVKAGPPGSKVEGSVARRDGGMDTKLKQERSGIGKKENHDEGTFEMKITHTELPSASPARTSVSSSSNFSPLHPETLANSQGGGRPHSYRKKMKSEILKSKHWFMRKFQGRSTKGILKEFIKSEGGGEIGIESGAEDLSPRVYHNGTTTSKTTRETVSDQEVSDKDLNGSARYTLDKLSMAKLVPKHQRNSTWDAGHLSPGSPFTPKQPRLAVRDAQGLLTPPRKLSGSNYTREMDYQKRRGKFSSLHSQSQMTSNSTTADVTKVPEHQHMSSDSTKPSCDEEAPSHVDSPSTIATLADKNSCDIVTENNTGTEMGSLRIPPPLKSRSSNAPEKLPSTKKEDALCRSLNVPEMLPSPKMEDNALCRVPNAFKKLLPSPKKEDALCRSLNVPELLPLPKMEDNALCRSPNASEKLPSLKKEDVLCRSPNGPNKLPSPKKDGAMWSLPTPLELPGKGVEGIEHDPKASPRVSPKVSPRVSPRISESPNNKNADQGTGFLKGGGSSPQPLPLSPRPQVVSFEEIIVGCNRSSGSNDNTLLKFFFKCREIDSLNKYLGTQKKRFLETSDSDFERCFHMILSGAGSGMSSMIAAICTTWLLEKTLGSTTSVKWHAIPVMNMNRKEMWQHRDAAWLFHVCGIDASAVLFLDEITPMNETVVAGRVKRAVIGLDLLVTKNEVGSSCTILTEKFRQEAPFLLQPRYMKTLLLAGILVDTDNLASGSTRDKDLATSLLVGAGSMGRNGFYNHLKQIRDAKYVSSFIREIYGDSNPFAVSKTSGEQSKPVNGAPQNDSKSKVSQSGASREVIVATNAVHPSISPSASPQNPDTKSTLKPKPKTKTKTKCDGKLKTKAPSSKKGSQLEAQEPSTPRISGALRRLRNRSNAH